MTRNKNEENYFNKENTELRKNKTKQNCIKNDVVCT